MVAVRAFLVGFLAYVSVVDAQPKNRDNDGLPAISIAAGIVSLVVVGAILLVAAVIFVKQRFLDPRTKSSAPSVISGTRSSPVEFSVKAIVASTRNFSERIGTGLLGSVYKGLLQSSTVVAVKKLDIVTSSERDFRSCVSDIGFLSHPTLVKLYGFATDGGADKMLVYEFLPNGSLDKLLFENPDRINWKFRYDTALSVARAVAYLHQQQFPMIHGNLKTENILLDGNYHAKISDTGLSLLADRKRIKSVLGSGRVHGYFSPEWIADSPLTTKTDVYGFGMILLEIIGGRRIVDLSQKSEQWNFVDWVSKQVKVGNYADIVDPRLAGRVDLKQLRTGTDVALWCIQEDAKSRPPMTRVVEALEKVMEIAAIEEAPPTNMKKSCEEIV